MIKVNLVGAQRKKTGAATRLALPTSATPVLLILIVLLTVGGGYWWYSSLSGQAAELESRIQRLEAQKAALDNVIKQDAIYETRKKALENRVKIIEDLQRDQISPVVALDALSEAVDKTSYVWLSSLDQNNAVFSMSGQGTSYEAVATFITNLEASGYFRNVDVPAVQEASPNTFTFSLKCEFLPRNSPAPSQRVEAATNGS